MTTTGTVLRVVTEPGGLRHYLEDDPIHAGDPLQLLMADGTWLSGRYENRRGQDYLEALFYFPLHYKTDRPLDRESPRGPRDFLDACVTLPTDALLRHPPRR